MCDKHCNQVEVQENQIVYNLNWLYMVLMVTIIFGVLFYAIQGVM